jgi:hypothetical protein
MDPTNLTVKSVGEGASTFNDIVCGAGKIMNGVQFKVLSLSGPTPRVTTIGAFCGNVLTSMVGSGEGLNFPPYFCGPGHKLEPRIIGLYKPDYQGLSVTTSVCAPNPQWLGATFTYDGLYTKPVAGELGGNGNPWIVRCPFDAVPIGLRVGREKTFGRVTTIGMICVGPDAN